MKDMVFYIIFGFATFAVFNIVGWMAISLLFALATAINTMGIAIATAQFGYQAIGILIAFLSFATTIGALKA